MLRPFDGDLDDYAQWLQKERSSKAAADTATHASTDKGSAASGTSDRRERAQQRAALAARRKPIEQAIRKIEQQMEELQARADEIDQALAAPDAFSDRAAATALQRERAQIGTALEALENDWLEQQERLEAVERA